LYERWEFFSQYFIGRRKKYLERSYKFHIKPEGQAMDESRLHHLENKMDFNSAGEKTICCQSNFQNVLEIPPETYLVLI